MLIYPLKEFVSKIKNNFHIIKNNNLIKEKVDIKTNENNKNNLFLNTNINNEDNIEYQNLSFDLNKEAISFIFLQNEIKKDFINYLKTNVDHYFKEISSTGKNLYNRNILDNNEMEQIIINEVIESHFKIIIHESLSKYAKFQNKFKLDHISVLVTGQSGVGVSTLIKCLFKEKVAEEGIYYIAKRITKIYKTTSFPFLHLTDTRGYELNRLDNYGSEYYINDIIYIIQSKKKPKNFSENIFDYTTGNEIKENYNYKENYHCVWFCVHGNELHNNEINVLRELKNRIKNIPIIVVYTRAIDQNEVVSMKNQIKNLFPDLKFIYILARKEPFIDSFGLDDLLNLTIETIKSMENNDIFEEVINEFKIK